MVAVILLLLFTLALGSVILLTVVAEARRSGQELLPEASQVRLEELKERSEELRARSHTVTSAALARSASLASAARASAARAAARAAAERRRDREPAGVA